jgi:ABC-2 type transport system permease protein
MNLQRSRAIVLRQIYLLRGSVARVLPLFIWVAIDIVLWGFITRYLNSVNPAMNFVPAFLGTVLLWDFFTRVMHGVSMAFLEDVWSRNFLNFFASPLRVSEYLGGVVITSVATSSVGLVVMLLLATGIFGLSYFVYGLMMIPFLLILFLFGIALGIFSCALVLRLGPASEWFIWPIPAFLSPFAGVFYPITTLPVWMQYISKLLPPSYVFEGMRAVLKGEKLHMANLLIGGALACGFIALASWTFSRVHKHALRTGLIARYSAETLS